MQIHCQRKTKMPKLFSDDANSDAGKCDEKITVEKILMKNKLSIMLMSFLREQFLKINF